MNETVEETYVGGSFLTRASFFLRLTLLKLYWLIAACLCTYPKAWTTGVQTRNVMYCVFEQAFNLFLF